MDDHEGVSQAPVTSNNAGKGKNNNLVPDATAFAVQMPTVTVTYSTCVYVCMR